MNKILINSKYALKMGVCILWIFIVAATVQAATKTVIRYDDFSDANLPAFWVADIDPSAFATGGGMVLDNVSGVLRFNNVWNNTYCHLQSASPVDVLRVDAIMYQTVTYPGGNEQSWGMGVGIYFDPNNYVALKQNCAGGAYGWGHYLFVNGSLDYWTGYTGAGLANWWMISGIELTPTEIIYYGSSIAPPLDKFGETDIDSSVSEITEFREPRPASFTGPALIIVGKGYQSAAGYARNPDWDNSISSDYVDAFSGIDLIRVKMNVDDPNYCGDTGTVYLEMDFNQDCIVDFKDLTEFVGFWLACTDPQDPYCDQFLP